jgi:hypothetical protein
MLGAGLPALGAGLRLLTPPGDAIVGLRGAPFRAPWRCAIHGGSQNGRPAVGRFGEVGDLRRTGGFRVGPKLVERLPVLGAGLRVLGAGLPTPPVA